MDKLNRNCGFNRWKIWCLFFFAIILFPYLSYATPDASVSSISGTPGSNVSVSVLADFDKTVNSIQFTLKFDPSLLTISSVKAGGSNSGWVLVDNPKVAGQVVVGMFNPGGPALSIKGTQQQIAFITFTVNNSPSNASNKSELTLSKVSFDATSVTNLRVGTFSIGAGAPSAGTGLKLKKLL